MVAEGDNNYNWFIKIIVGYHYNYSICHPASHSGMGTHLALSFGLFLNSSKCAYLILIFFSMALETRLLCSLCHSSACVPTTCSNFGSFNNF